MIPSRVHDLHFGKQSYPELRCEGNKHLLSTVVRESVILVYMRPLFSKEPTGFSDCNPVGRIFIVVTLVKYLHLREPVIKEQFRVFTKTLVYI